MLPTLTSKPLMWALTRSSPGNLHLSRARKFGTTHRLPTVALGSKWSRAALQEIRHRGSETLRLGSSF